MAFDLVQYFNEQTIIQKPSLLNQYSIAEKKQYIHELNALILGKLIILWRESYHLQFKNLQTLPSSYLLDITHQLSTSSFNESNLEKKELNSAIYEILNLQLLELQQLEKTGQYGAIGLRELILAQIEHLTGQADNWVWLTNTLIELKDSKPTHQDNISLEQSITEFNLMANQSHEDSIEIVPTTPIWAKIVEPIVALAILWILFNALCNVFA